MSVQLLEEVRNAWGWTGIEPVEMVGDNDFGNLILKDVRGHYWRLCPEDLYCAILATSREELDRLSADQEFLSDWYMRALVAQAYERLGVLPEGRKYCLKIPGVLGGEYGGTNLATIPFDQLIRVSGEIAKKIADLPDRTQVKLTIVD